jgi:hypothetical protein
MTSRSSFRFREARRLQPSDGRSPEGSRYVVLKNALAES